MKNGINRIFAVILLVSLMLSVLPHVQIFALQTDGVIRIEQVTAEPGSTVEVDILVENNPGIYSLEFRAGFTSEYLTLTGIAYNPAFGGSGMVPPLGNSFSLSWFNSQGMEDVTTNGVLATLTFQVSQDAPEDQLLQIDFVSGSLECYNVADQELAVSLVNGGILVQNGVFGDINGDRKATTRDVTRLHQYVTGWPVEVDPKAIDTNGDGKVSTRDVTRLHQYVAGWDVEIFYNGRSNKQGHTLQQIPAKEATCTEPGNIAYWTCTECGKFFSDANGATQVSLEDVIVYAAEHSALTEVSAKAPTCTEPGIKTHWHCTTCDKYYADASAKTELTKDQTVDPATGHKLSKVEKVEPTYTEPGVKEHWKCTVCGTLFADEKGETKLTVQDTVIAPKKSYQISYDLYDGNSTYLEKVGVENPNAAFYDPEKGLVLEDLQAEGYTFKGWFDDDGKQVREIETGKTGNIWLNAKWEPKTYTLTMRDLVDDSKTVSFTPETQMELETPVWRHLNFSHWEDTSGKLEKVTDATGTERMRLNQGTIGNIEVIAKWKNPINQVVPSKNENNLIGFKYLEDAQMYWFVYELGKIEKVILGNKEDYPAQHHSGGNKTLTHTEQVEISEETGKSIAELSSSTVSKSEGWEETTEMMLSISETLGMTMKTGIEAEAGVEGIGKVKESIEMETSIDLTVQESLGVSQTKDSSETVSKEAAQEVSNSFVYSKTVSYAKAEETKLTPEDPIGYYRNVNAATVKIYAVVIYDPMTKTCYLETYSVISETCLYPLYEREGYVDYANESISYSIDEGHIEECIRSLYYIQYDAYEGNEAMPIEVAVKGVETTLRDDFTRTGYTLTGWRYTDENGVEQILTCDLNGEIKVKDLTEGGKTVTLQAIWTKNNYTIQYVADKPLGPTFDVNNMPKDQPCRYDEKVKLAGAPTLTGWKFDGWYYNGEKLDPGSEVENLTSEVDGAVTLTGTWTAKDYTITYHKNDGSGVTTTATYVFDNTVSTLKADSFTRTNYAHIGWSKDKNATVPTYKKGETVGELAHSADAINGNINLYAVWIPTTGSWDNGLSDSNNIAVRNDGYECFFQTNLNREELKAAGYTMVSIAGTIRGQRIYSWGAYDWYIEIYDRTDVKIHSDEIGKFDTSWETRNIQYTIPIDCIRDDGTIKVRFDHSGGSNERGQYRLGLIQITATAK